MDQRGEREDSSDHRRGKGDVVDTAADGAMNNHAESMDHQRDGGYEEEAGEETATVLKEVEVEVVGGSEEEEAASAPLSFAHPCSLLHLLLRACAGCLSLHGYRSDDDDDDDPKPAAATGTDDVAVAAAPAGAAAAAATESPQEGDHQGGGDKAASEVVTQVWATMRWRPPPPGRPREGSGGNGGNHH